MLFPKSRGQQSRAIALTDPCRRDLPSHGALPRPSSESSPSSLARGPSPPSRTAAKLNLECLPKGSPAANDATTQARRGCGGPRLRRRAAGAAALVSPSLANSLHAASGPESSYRGRCVVRSTTSDRLGDSGLPRPWPARRGVCRGVTCGRTAAAHLQYPEQSVSSSSAWGVAATIVLLE